MICVRAMWQGSRGISRVWELPLAGSQKERGPQFYNYKELNSANIHTNLEEEPSSRKKAAWLILREESCGLWTEELCKLWQIPDPWKLWNNNVCDCEPQICGDLIHFNRRLIRFISWESLYTLLTSIIAWTPLTWESIDLSALCFRLWAH